MILICIRTAAVVAAVALAVAGCGEDAESGGGSGPRIVATTGFAADIVEGVAGGQAQVTQLVPDSASPHSYGASAKDRRTLAEADLVVAIGANYEAGLPLGETDAPRFELADHVGKLRAGGGDEHADEDAGASADPHVWMDPARVAGAVPRLADALAEADPSRERAYADGARRHAGDLRALDAEIREILAAIPADRRKLVTSHDSLGYFAARYDLAFVGAPFGASPEAEASASTIASVIARVRRERVPAVFAQAGDDPKVMRQIAEEARVRVVDDLLVENPGPQGPTYAEALLHDARRIAEALGG